MSDSLHIVCPHCDTINRVPTVKLSAGGKCGQCHQPLFAGGPLALDSARFARHAEKSDVPLLIDFWAEWCGPCRAMAPAFARAAQRLEPGIRLAKVNIDENPDLAQRFGVSSIPTMILVLHGKEIDRIVGARTEVDLVDWASQRPAA
ncbi:MAG TPA: thioredoxin [Stellaceae bacterium]|jgi:thioredoxin 2